MPISGDDHNLAHFYYWQVILGHNQCYVNIEGSRAKRSYEAIEQRERRIITGDQEVELHLSIKVKLNAMVQATAERTRHGLSRFVPKIDPRCGVPSGKCAATRYRRRTGVDPVGWTPLKLVFEVSDTPLPNRLSAESRRQMVIWCDLDARPKSWRGVRADRPVDFHLGEASRAG